MAADPWAEFSPQVAPKAADDPWKDFSPQALPKAEKPQGIVGSAWDAFQGIPRNLMAGALDAGTAGAQAEAHAMSQPELASEIPNTEQSLKEIEKGVTGPLYQPQTGFGKIVGEGARFAGNPASYVGPQGMLPKAGIAFTGGMGSEAAGEGLENAGAGPVTQTVGRIAAALLGGYRRGVKPPLEAAPEAPLGVTLSKGQTTGDLATIQSEQAAARGQLGTPAQERATAFGNQQQEQIGAAKENIARQFDPYDTPQSRGSIAAETPQDAGQLVSQGIQTAAGRAKAGVTQAYDTARGLGGTLEPGVFEGIGQKIKWDLSQGDNPVIINEKLTPHADAMLKDVEDNISRLNIPNRASPFGSGPPNLQEGETFAGVNLNGVDQIRRRLSSFRKSAWGSGDAADGRAASAVLDAFDKRIDEAVNGGAFTGDPRAVEAWNNARAAFSDYKSTFSAGKNDPVGRVMEKIIGKGAADPEIPAKVADHLYGASGLSPNTTNVGVANRVKSILGEQSPEWTAVKQGLFSRLTENQGLTEWGAQKTGNRLNDFLNGRGQDMAKAVFSPQERELLQKFVDLQEKLIVPQRGANWSNTAAGTMPMLRKITQAIATSIGVGIGHAILPGTGGELIGGAAGYGAGKLTSGIGDVKRARQIADQMPLIGDSIRNWQKAASAPISSGTAAKALLANTANALARNLSRIGVAISAAELQHQAITPMQTSEGHQYYQLNPPQQKKGGKVLERLERSRGRLAKIGT